MSRLIVAALLFVSVIACESAPQKPATAAPSTPAPAAAEAKPNMGPDPATLVGATAVIETTMGKLTCKLFAKETPKTVANFVGLAEGTRDWKHPLTKSPKVGVPLYDGTIFHRVIPDFMIQGGDPLGNGSGDPGYSFEDEIVPTLKFDRPGRLAMANSGPDTNGSQFFITEVPTPHLNGKHTIFGQCDAASVALVRKIARVPRDERNDKPFKPVKIEKITIMRAETK
ncbi:MAG TPA: peptidylprolyl isomerase [Terriglobales bacterium]|nr:peptidylprolyl isomerase [Terriglobales bacterium]